MKDEISERDNKIAVLENKCAELERAMVELRARNRGALVAAGKIIEILSGELRYGDRERSCTIIGTNKDAGEDIGQNHRRPTAVAGGKIGGTEKGKRAHKRT